MQVIIPKNVSHASTKMQKDLEKHLFGVFLQTVRHLKTMAKTMREKLKTK